LAGGDETNKPGWYDQINSKLTLVKLNAQRCLDNIAPEMTQLPQAFINLANGYDAASSPLADSFDKLIAAQGADRERAASDAGEVIDYLVTDAQMQSAKVRALNNTVLGFMTTLNTEIEALVSGAHSVTEALTEEKERVVNITKDIAALQAEIEKRYEEIIRKLKVDDDNLKAAGLVRDAQQQFHHGEGSCRELARYHHARFYERAAGDHQLQRYVRRSV
jgi:septal ring factor EnvC (AmiA/AmiB activator)